MNTVILRNIPNEIMSLFRKRAAEQKTSLNKAVIQMLVETFGKESSKEKIYHDLDDWFGGWTKEEADEFNRRLFADRRRDAELQRRKDELSR